MAGALRTMLLHTATWACFRCGQQSAAAAQQCHQFLCIGRMSRHQHVLFGLCAHCIWPQQTKKQQ